MKYKVILSVLLVSAGLQAQSRLVIKNQKGFSYGSQHLSDSAGMAEPDFAALQVQIRFTRSDWSTGLHKLLVLNQDKKANWQGKLVEYHYYNKEHANEKPASVRPVRFKETWPSSWQVILRNDYLNLPDLKSVLSRVKSPDREVLLVAGGVACSMEVLTKRSKRKVTYANPESFYAYYTRQGIQVQELEGFLALLKILAGEFDMTTE